MNVSTNESTSDDAVSRRKDMAQFVEFEVNEQNYAFPIGEIREIVILKSITPAPQVPAFVEISEDQFQRFQTLIYDHCGIRLDDRKQLLLRTRLQRRLRQIGMDDVEKYLAIITRSNGRDEFQSLIDVVTTNETSFFRTQSHFDWFCKDFLPTFGKQRGTCQGQTRTSHLVSGVLQRC